MVDRSLMFYILRRKGLYILDLDNIHQQPRFIPQGGKWQIAE